MKQIGKGAFSRVYLKEDGKTVSIKSCCPIKECMSMGWFPDSPLFPVVERIDCCDDGVFQIFEMKYYPRVTSLKNTLKPEQWKIYKTLRGIHSSYVQPKNIHGSFNALYKAFETIQDEELRETMLDALNACSNYGSDIGFEISPRNVAVDDGNLVLLDVFFMKSRLEEVRTGSIKNR